MKDIIKDWNNKVGEITIDKIPVYRIIQDYKKGKIFLKPAYQRIYKWDRGQKSKLIESIFLGLPLPSIFIYGESKLSYEVIDGLQRLSTIFEFLGVLKSTNIPWTYLTLKRYLNDEIYKKIEKLYKEIDDLKNSRISYLALGEFDEAKNISEEINKKNKEIENIIKNIKNKDKQFKKELKKLKDDLKNKKLDKLNGLAIIEGLNGKVFDDLEEDLKNDFMYKVFNFTVLNPKDSDQSIKYELFYRLNSGGTSLTPQEVRNSLILYLKPKLYYLILEIKDNLEEYKYQSILGTKLAKDHQKILETILKYYTLIYSELQDKINNVQRFIDSFVWKIIKNEISLPKKELLYNTFKIINESFGKNTLKRYKNGKFTGDVMVPAFDAIAGGIGYNFKEGNISESCIEDENCIEEIRKRIKALWMSEQWNKHISATWFVEHKLQVAMFIGRKLFNLKESFGKTEKEIAEAINKLIDLEFNKK